MKIAIIGTGYVGLVTGTVFAEWGNTVTCVDKIKEKIENLKKGIIPIYEPGLEELVNKNVKAKRLSFTTDTSFAVKNSETVFICVGTPPDRGGDADLSAVWTVSKAISKNLNSYKIIVTKSTVPVGTNEKIYGIIKNFSKKGCSFDVVSNPEFLREGSSIFDANNPSRIVLGGTSKKALKKIKSLYTHLHVPIIECDLRSAEMVKYASNAFLATKISFINEIAQICDRAGADVKIVADGMGYDKRIGRAFLNAGLGYGGSCLPKDVEAMYRTSTDKKYDFRLLRGVMDVNQNQRVLFVEKIKKEFSGKLCGRTIACLGAAFKANTDDIRESVAIKVIKMLRGEGAKIRLYDPVALSNARKVLGNTAIEYCTDMYSAVEKAEALCLLTEFSEFREIDLKKVKEKMAGNYIFDGRNLLDPNKVVKANFKYFGIGRGILIE